MPLVVKGHKVVRTEESSPERLSKILTEFQKEKRETIKAKIGMRNKDPIINTDHKIGKSNDSVNVTEPGSPNKSVDEETGKFLVGTMRGTTDTDDVKFMSKELKESSSPYNIEIKS